MKEKVIIISGPTGIGKTKLSLEIAKKLNAEIISADSMQIYRRMDIGTAKIMPDEMQSIPHHLIDIVDPNDSYSVQNFKNDAYNLIEEIINRGKTPLVVGGTGLYIDSLMFNYSFSDVKPNYELRKELESEFDQNPADLLEKLQEIDKEKYHFLGIKDKKKVIRALEVFYSSGKTISYDREDKNDKYKFYLFVLTDNRDKIYQNINKRVDLMLEQGLLNEVKSLIESGVDRNSQSMKAIGYREVLEYFDGSIDYLEMVEKLKQNSRRYAKRQLTWFRRNPHAKWIDKSKKEEEIVNYILKEIE